MKNPFVYFTFLLVISVFVFSCEKESLYFSESEETLEPRYSQEDLDQKIHEAGEFFSAYLADEIMLTSLLASYDQECIEEFLLLELIKSMPEESPIYVSLDQMVRVNPLITVAFPSFAFHDNETFNDHLLNIDYTVILSENPEKTNTLPAYDSEGKLINISSEFDETKRYCVLKYSENKIAVNTSQSKTLFGEVIPSSLSDFNPDSEIGSFKLYSGQDYILARLIDEGLTELNASESGISYLDVCSGSGLGEYVDPRNCMEPCERDCPPKTKDELHRIKWSSKSALKVFESGFNLPTVEMVVYYGIPTFISSTKVDVKIVPKTVIGHWKNFTEKWSPQLKLEIETWDPSQNMADNWYVTWFERDNWNKVNQKFTIGFSAGGTIDGVEVKANVGYDISINKNDKAIGSSTIEYCDPALGEGSKYHPYSYLNDGEEGGFWFREHVKSQ